MAEEQESPKRELSPVLMGLAAVSALHLMLQRLLPSPLFEKYPDIARQLRAGQLSADSGGDASPLYLALNLAMSPGALRWFQALASVLCLVAILRLARELFGNRAGWIATGLAAVSSPLIVYAAALEPDLLMTCSAFGAVSLLVAPIESRPRWVSEALAGALLGLAIALRPSCIVPAAALILVQLLLRRSVLVFGAALFLAAVVPLLGIRAVAGSSVLATMSSGAVLQMGNRPDGPGLGAQPLPLLKRFEAQLLSRERPDHGHALYRRFARDATGEKLTPAETQRYWIGKTLAFPLSMPWEYLKLVGRKLTFGAAGLEAHDFNDSRNASRKLSDSGLPGLRFLSIVGVAGLIVSLFRRRRAEYLWVFVLGGAAVLLVTYVTARYALLLVPAWCVLGGLLVDELLGCWRNVRSVVACGLGAAVVLVIQISPRVADAAAMLDRSAAASPHSKAMRELRARGEYAGASEAFVRLHAAQPLFTTLYDLRGIPFESPAIWREAAAQAIRGFETKTGLDFYLLAHQSLHSELYEAAVQAAQGAEAVGFRSATTDSTLEPLLVEANARRALDDVAGAADALARAVDENPGSLDVLAMAVAWANDGAPELETRLFAFYDPISAHFALSQAHRAVGKHEQALKHAEFVHARLSDAAVVEHEYALALLGAGRQDEALASLARAFDLFPTGAFAVAPFVPVLQRLTEGSAQTQWDALAAQVMLRAGFVAESQRLEARARGEGGVPAAAAQP